MIKLNIDEIKIKAKQDTKLHEIFNFANAVTFLRFILTFVCGYFITARQFEWALIVLIIAAFSDFFDGWVARTFNCLSTFGKKIDPKADKFMLILIVFFSPIIASLVLILEIIGQEFSAIIRSHRKAHYISAGSKYITGLQFIFLCCLILNNIITSVDANSVEGVLLFALVGLSFVRMIIYSKEYLAIHTKLPADHNFFTMANYISLLGLSLIPVILWLYHNNNNELVIIVYGIAWLTDLLDGWVAKTLYQKTIIGARLDVVRDKALLIVMVTICWPEWWYIVSILLLELIALIFFRLRREITKLPQTDAVLQESRITTIIQGLLLLTAFGLKNMGNMGQVAFLMIIGNVVLMASGFRAITYMIYYFESLSSKNPQYTK